MSNKFWSYLAYGFFATQTHCVVILLEFLIFGRPYISLFWGILVLTVHFNLKRHPELPIAKYWPFIN